MKGASPNGFQLGGWRVYPLRNVLVGPAGETHVEPKAMQLLERLAVAAGEVVEREQLLEDLWHGRAMTDEPLTRCIATLRRVLDDSAKDPKYIQTIPKRGYRLVCPVESLEEVPGETPATFPGRPVRRLDVYAVAIAITLAVMAVVAYQLLPGDPADRSSTTIADSTALGLPEHSIAVLPFANLSPDPDNEYLSDGLAAELMNLLVSIPDLKVAARTSAFAFKNKNLNVSEIARQLRVAHILSGTVRQSEDVLRISAQLIDASSGYQVWSNTWQSELKDIFAIQDEIAAAVVDSLRVQLLDVIPTKARADPEAYALYLKSGEAFLEKKEPVAGQDPSGRHAGALSLITHAIAIDPSYAPAWARLAGIQFDRAQWTTGADATELYAQARASAERALSLDPNQVVALRYLGAIEELWDWDSELAAKWYKKALRANRGNAITLRAIESLYFSVGLPAPAFVRDAPDPDPLNPTKMINLALRYWHEGQFDAARDQLELARNIAPDAIRLRSIEALFFYLDGDYEKSALLLADGLNPPLHACVLHAIGRLEEAQAVLESIQKEDTLRSYPVAQIYACWGERDKAFASLKRAYEEHDQRLRRLRRDLTMTNLHSDPRWDALLKRTGMSDADAEKVRSIIERSGLDF